MEVTAERARAPLSLRPLPSFLADTKQGKLRYILKAWLLVFVPSIALAFAIPMVANEAAGPEFEASGLTLMLLLVVFSPVVETLLMIPPLLVIDRLAGPRAAIVFSALLWAVLHSLAAPFWGLVVWWPFLILSAVFLVWRREHGLTTAIAMTIAVHALQNAVVGSTMLFS